MKAILVLTFCAPIILQAQIAKLNSQHVNNPITRNIKDERPGIIWVDNLNWQQVLKKAMKEKKYIFIDCFTSWCGPCKKMDKDVYTNDSVGNLLNAKFISVKLQMDSTKGDSDFTRSWYKTAREMETTYRVAAYPTFLFFSPNGEIVYKDFGYKVPANFLQVVQDALTASKQYYVLLKEYKKGKKDYVNMPFLITMLRQLGDTANYRPLLKDYYAHLKSLVKDKLYTKENIEFIASTISRSSQAPFSMFYPDGKAVDDVMKKDGYAKDVVNLVIFKEKISPFLRAAEGKPEPDWNILYNTIAKNYKGDYADRNVMDAKLNWYQANDNALKYATVLNDKIEKYGSDTTDMGEDFKLNTQAYLLWLNIKDVVELKRITNWMAGVVKRSEMSTGEYIEYRAYYIDTYANLLYKVGETTEALKWQEMAVKKGRELSIDKSFLNAIENNFEKMKKGEPTWPDNKK
jgi:thioredoxin-related protein